MYSNYGYTPSSTEEIKAYNLLRELQKAEYFAQFKSLRIEQGLKCCAKAEARIKITELVHFRNNEQFTEWLCLFFLVLYINNVALDRNLFLKRFYETIVLSTHYVTNIYEKMQSVIAEINRLAKMTDIIADEEPFALKYEYPENGHIYNLPQYCIRYEDGYCELSHPNHYGDDLFPTYKKDCVTSKKTMNSEDGDRRIKPLLISVYCENGKIYSANIIEKNFNEESSTEPSRRPIDNYKISAEARQGLLRKFRQSPMPKVYEPRIEKSEYFGLLATLQDNKYDILFCNEKMCAYTSRIVYSELSILFTLKRKNGSPMLVFENYWDSRSTYLFYCDRFSLTNATKAVFDFFSSTLDNKREKLVYHEIEPKELGVLHYERLNHRSYNEWVTMLKYYLI